MSNITSAGVAQFFSPMGQELWAKARAEEYDAASFMLAFRNAYPLELLRVVANQLDISTGVRRKFPSLAPRGVVLDRSLFEQASCEAVARFRATYMQGDTLCDITGGAGIDTFFLASSFSTTHYVEIDPVRHALFCENSRRWGASSSSLETFCADSLSYLKDSRQTYDWIFVDPARRSGDGTRHAEMSAWRPDIVAQQQLLCSSARKVGVKIAPAYDITRLRKEISTMESLRVISVGGEVKEIFAQMSAQGDSIRCTLHAVCLTKEGTPFFEISREGHGDRMLPSSSEATYLYDPDAALIKAGLVHETGALFSMSCVAPHGVLLLKNSYEEDFPGRVLRIQHIFSWSKKRTQTYLRTHGVVGATIIRRDFPLSVQEIRRRFHLFGESANTFLYFTTRGCGERIVIHAEREL
ncbi:THUMP-like domain-containing protein [Chitinivibrio alkaliphilus]|uniref:THUMP-like domain-containing protein n=1 Tax=Chitinivibrio alkaliphilus ACht1 TaxID=1313304 RepID=U7D5N0_9BACT|nr:hypothetical protein [Chitinivibrio alkaliphilus]ERP31278.1 hypothetical protein CALK_1766 [Chitinivibrio alkaliphilus ACht1]